MLQRVDQLLVPVGGGFFGFAGGEPFQVAAVGGGDFLEGFVDVFAEVYGFEEDRGLGEGEHFLEDFFGAGEGEFLLDQGGEVVEEGFEDYDVAEGVVGESGRGGERGG